MCLVCVCLCEQLAFKFVPSREAFLSNLGDGPGLMAEMKAFIDAFSEVLAEVHKFLVGAGCGGLQRGGRGRTEGARAVADRQIVPYGTTGLQRECSAEA